jgi:hypothetical protein
MRPRFLRELKAVDVLTDIYPHPLYGYHDPSYAYKESKYRVQFRKFAFVVPLQDELPTIGSTFGPSQSMKVAGVATCQKNTHVLTANDVMVFIDILKNSTNGYSKKSTWPTCMDHFIAKFKIVPKIVVINKASTNGDVIYGRRCHSKRFAIETSPLGWFWQNLHVDNETQPEPDSEIDDADGSVATSSTLEFKQENVYEYDLTNKTPVEENHIFFEELQQSSEELKGPFVHLY